MKYKATCQPQDFVDTIYYIEIVGSNLEITQALEIIAKYSFRTGNPQKVLWRNRYKGYAHKYYEGELPDVIPEMKTRFGNGIPSVQNRIKQDHDQILHDIRNVIDNVELTEHVRREIIHSTGPY